MNRNDFLSYSPLSTAVDPKRAFTMEEVVLLLYLGYLLARKIKKLLKPRTKWSREWLLKKREFFHVKLLKKLKMNQLTEKII